MIALLAALLLAQDAVQLADARERAAEARRKCASLVVGTDGLSSIGLAGSGTDYRILLVVRDPAVKKSLQDRLGGDQCGGIPILWSVKNTAAAVPLGADSPAAPPAVAPEPPGETGDPSTLDYRRRWWPTQIWTYTPPGWWRPWIVWEYDNGWHAYKLRRRDYGSGKIWWR